MAMNRREMMATLAALAVAGGVRAEAQMEKTLTESHVYAFDKLPVQKHSNGQVSRAVFDGVLPTGEKVEMHETTLPPGQMPHPPHRHRHSEMMLIREGQLECTSDGVAETIGPGGVFFVGSNTLHGVKCVGDAAANYFVIAMGRERVVTPVGAAGYPSH